MLGFSIQKLLVLAAIIGAVWYGFKLVGRLDQARKADARGTDRKRATGRSWWPGKRDREEKGGAQVEAQDMVLCPRCKTYVTSLAAHDCESDG